MKCGLLNSPSSVPSLPHDLTKMPFLSKWTTRELP